MIDKTPSFTKFMETSITLNTKPILYVIVSKFVKGYREKSYKQRSYFTYLLSF